MQDPLLTTKQAARLLALQPCTLEKWRHTGDGPLFLKIGLRSVRYTREDLQSFLERRRSTANTSRQKKSAAQVACLDTETKNQLGIVP